MIHKCPCNIQPCFQSWFSLIHLIHMDNPPMMECNKVHLFKYCVGNIYLAHFVTCYFTNWDFVTQNISIICWDPQTVVHCRFQNGFWTELSIQNSALSYCWSGWQTPLWLDSQNFSAFLSLILYSFNFLSSRALKISSSGPNSCWELHATFAAGPKNFSSLQQQKVLPVFQFS